MTIQWVCPECGLDYDTISPRDAAGAVRTFPRRYRNVLTRSFVPGEDLEAIIRTRPAEGVWSALEYTCHVAQTLDLMAPTIRQIVNEDNPHLYAWDPDEQAEEQDYNDWTLLTALASYQVDSDIVDAFRAQSSASRADADLIAATAWASLTAARRAGEWLAASSKGAG